MVAEFSPSCAHEADDGSSRSWTCLDVYRAAPAERMAMIRRGVRASWAKAILGDFMRGCGHDLAELKLSRSVIGRKAALEEYMSHEQGERLVGVAELIGQIETMMSESGRIGEFDASDWFAQWATSPLPALSGVRPIEYLDTSDGRAVVSSLLAQMQSGAYA